jgi:Leucine-rich repeat (LRR) protein
MAPEEEAYEEALRRIREEETGALDLSLSELTLNRLPPELERLTSLQSLDLSGCSRLSGDISPLASLTSLQTLDLSSCERLSGDLSPLAGLTALQSLNLRWCEQLSGDLSRLTGLTSLQKLILSHCGFRRFAPLQLCCRR